MKTISILFILSNLGYGITYGKSNKGYQIAKKAREFHANYVDYKSEGTMTTYDKSGNENVRNISIRVKEGKNEQDKALLIFKAMNGMPGTALLTHVYPGEDDNQWIYLSEIKKLKRIVSSNRSSSFLGSEFTFEDLMPRVVEDYNYKFKKQATCLKGETCSVLIARPKDRNSAYSKQEIWITKKNQLLVRAKYFNKRGEHYKTLTNKRPKKFKGKFWNFRVFEMINHKTKRKTIFRYNAYTYRNSFNNQDFDKAILKRIVK